MNSVIIALAPVQQRTFDTFPTAEELADEIVECHAAGAAVLHLHVIDHKGNQTTDTSCFKRAIDHIRSRCDMVIEGSTGGPLDMTPDQRSVCLGVEGVEMASLNMGSVNVGDGVYINSLKDVLFWSEKMKRHKVAPDMAFFEVGMLSRIAELQARGLVGKPYCASLALGFAAARTGCSRGGNLRRDPHGGEREGFRASAAGRGPAAR